MRRLTSPLQADSPAIGAGVAAYCPGMDQLGNVRPQPAGTRCDSGAVEYTGPPLISSQQQAVDETAEPLDTNAPQNVQSLVRWNGIQLNWEAPSDVPDAYHVYRKYGNETGYRYLNLVVTANDSESLSYFDTMNFRSGTYNYYVLAVHLDEHHDHHQSETLTVEVNDSDLQTPTATATLQTADDVPRNLRASSVSPAGIQLAWDAPTTAVRGYLVLRRRVDWAQTEFETIGTMLAATDSQPATSYRDNMELSAGRYIYAVKSLLSDNTHSDASATLSLDVSSEQIL